MPNVPSRKVIIKEPEKTVDISYLLRVESSGVEVSGPTFLYFENGVQIWRWSKAAAQQLSRLDEAEQRAWLKQHGELLYPEPIKPPPLEEGYKRNFALLREAHNDGNLALVSAIRKSDKMPVALVCAMSHNEDDDSFTPVPIAVMIDGNPFDLFEDPTVL